VEKVELREVDIENERIQSQKYYAFKPTSCTCSQDCQFSFKLLVAHDGVGRVSFMDISSDEDTPGPIYFTLPS